MIFWILWLVLAVAFVLFGAVVFSGAPYVPTLSGSTKNALNLLDLKKGQVFYDLGCGDGRVLMAAAERGLTAIGYELNPLLVLVARWRNRRYGSKVRVRWGSFWSVSLADADGVYIFLADLHMKRLDRFLAGQNKSLKLATNAFKIPGKKPAGRRGSVYLYLYK